MLALSNSTFDGINIEEDELHSRIEMETGMSFRHSTKEDLGTQLRFNRTKHSLAMSLLIDRREGALNLEEQSLYDLLIRHGKAQCSDQRDRVFALIGLVQASDEFIDLERHFPDYTLTEDQSRDWYACSYA